jgi:methyl-accepting chemotaxis protein
MFDTVTLRRKFLILAVVTSTLIVILGGISLYSTHSLDKALRHVAWSGQALGNFLIGDMMHDALKSDTLAALVIAGGDNIGDADSIRKSIEGNAETFRQSIRDNEALPLSPAILTAINEVKPALNAYIATALRLLELSFKDRSAAIAQMPEFFKAFDQLAKDNERVGELIESDFITNQKISAEASSTADIAVGGTAVAAFILFAVITIFIVRSIEAPLRLCADALNRIGNGDTDV